jgi:hypothetical protein
MNSKKTFATVVLAMIFGLSVAAAQTHFTFTPRTGSYATVGVPTVADPQIAGAPLSSGDEIGAFSPAGLCVGACVWTGVTTTIAVWANDPMTPETDGMISGQSISYRIWDASTGIEYPAVTVNYSMGNGIFQPNGLYVLSSISTVTPLPVGLMMFKAAGAILGTHLNWTTATEVNNYGFEVQRKPAKRTEWQEIGFIDGAGTTNTPKAYAFFDRDLTAGTYSYRLKQIDHDGKFSYSSEVEAMAAAPKNFALLQNFPNPFNPSTTIVFTVPANGHATLKIINTIGQEIATLFDGEVQAGIGNQVKFNASGFASGVYCSRLEYNGNVQMKKMLLNK